MKNIVKNTFIFIQFVAAKSFQKLTCALVFYFGRLRGRARHVTTIRSSYGSWGGEGRGDREGTKEGIGVGRDGEVKQERERNAGIKF